MSIVNIVFIMKAQKCLYLSLYVFNVFFERTRFNVFSSFLLYFFI